MRKNIQLTSKAIRYALVLSAIDQCVQLMEKWGYSRSSILTACVSVDIAYHQIGYVDPNTNTYYFNPPYYSHAGLQQSPILSMSTDRYLQLLVSKTKEVLLTRQYLKDSLPIRPHAISLKYRQSSLQVHQSRKQCHAKASDLFKYGLPERKPEQTLSEYVDIFTKKYREIPKRLTPIGRRKPAWR